MNNIKWAYNVINAWGNFIINNEEANIRAKKRANICKDCVFIKEHPLLNIIKDNEIPEISGKYCKDCGCPLSAKTRSTTECNLGYWQL